MTYREYSNTEISYSGIPCVYGQPNISGGCHGMTHDRTMIWSPWLANQSLGSVSSLTPTLIDTSKNTDTGYIINRIMMSENYTFSLVRDTSDSNDKIHRTKILDFSQNEYDPEAIGNHDLLGFALYNENEMYTFEEDWNGDDEFRICKVTWTDGVPTTEVKYSVSAYPTLYGGYEWSMYYFYGMYYFKSGNYEKIIVLLNQYAYDYPSTNPVEFMLQFIVFDISLETTNELWVVPDDNYSIDLNEFTWDTTPPAFYETKMIVTVGLGGLSTSDPHHDDDPPVTRSWFKTIILDISSDNITSCQNWTSSDWDFNQLYEVGGIIDYNAKIYYFEAWLESETAYCIFSVNLEGTPTQTLVRAIDVVNTYGYHYFQAAEHCYGVERYPIMPSSTGVYEIQSNTHVCDINVDYSIYSGHYFESVLSLDTANNMLWSFRSDKLEGKSLVGGSDRDISVAWGGGTVPFSYASYRNVSFRIYNDNALAMVESYRSSPTAYQCDIYLLKET